MDKQTLQELLIALPDDATEISIPRHDSNELLFNSDLLTKDTAKLMGAVPAQKGTYHGAKRRWKVASLLVLPWQGQQIKTEDLPLTTMIPDDHQKGGDADNG